MFNRPELDEPIVVTGIGLITALGTNRESSWAGIQRGECGIDWIRGLRGIPDETIFGAQISLPEMEPDSNELKALLFNRRATREAIEDAEIDWNVVDPARTGCAISGHTWAIHAASKSTVVIWSFTRMIHSHGGLRSCRIPPAR